MDLIKKLSETRLPKPVSWVTAVVLSQPAAGKYGPGPVKEICENVERTLAVFRKDAGPAEKKRLRRQMLYARFAYLFSYQEFFLLHFLRLSDKGRRSFVGDIERGAVLFAAKDSESEEKINDKAGAAETFGALYARDTFLLEGKKDLSGFKAFLSAHPKCIVKPTLGQMGIGIRVINAGEPGFDPEGIIPELLKEGSAIVEELVIQCDEMAAFHPASVNTVRLATYCKGDSVTDLFSFFRMGRGGSVVDNAGSGGIFASVDVETGIVFTSGCTENGKRFLIHPDSGKQIIGFQIPRWNELLEVAHGAARKVSRQHYMGWDFALTDDGWVMIEGNPCGQFVQQICEQKGCRDRLREVFDGRVF